MTVKKTISRWPDKFYDFFPQNIETDRVSYVMINFIPFNNSWWEERVSKKSMFCFKEKNMMYISRDITRASWRD